MAIAVPEGIEQEDLLFSALEAAMIGDLAYYAGGALSGGEIEGYLVDTHTLAMLLQGYGVFEQIGELGEKPGKTESKTTKLATRNYSIPGKRTSTVELLLNGISEKQKNYFEGTLFAGQEITIILVKNEMLSADQNDVLTCMFPTSVVIFSGMRWTAEWAAEADGLWSVTLSTIMSGSTAGRIWQQAIPAWVEPE